MQNIIEQTKKKADAIAACTELEEKIQELLETETETENSNVADKHRMPPPSAIPKSGKSHQRKKKINDEDDSSDSEEDVRNTSIVQSEWTKLILLISYI